MNCSKRNTNKILNFLYLIRHISDLFIPYLSKYNRIHGFPLKRVQNYHITFITKRNDVLEPLCSLCAYSGRFINIF